MTMQMINEARDSIRYGYATGCAHLHAVADRVSVLTYERKLSPDERDRLHNHPRRVFGALDRVFDKVLTALGDDGCCRTYSDGDPAYSTVRPGAGRLPPSSECLYWGDIGPENLQPGPAPTW